MFSVLIAVSLLVPQVILMSAVLMFASWNKAAFSSWRHFNICPVYNKQLVRPYVWQRFYFALLTSLLFGRELGWTSPNSFQTSQTPSSTIHVSTIDFWHFSKTTRGRIVQENVTRPCVTSLSLGLQGVFFWGKKKHCGINSHVLMGLCSKLFFNLPNFIMHNCYLRLTYDI